MAIAARFGLCSLLAFALIGACSTSHVSDDESCTPDSERECMCGDEPGVQICNTQGSGYGACECTTSPGGSGGGGGSSGSDADGSAGTAGSGGSAGSAGDASTPETDGGETDGGETTDAAPSRDALAPPTEAGGTTCEGGDACLDCIAASCCDEFNACVEPDTCAAEGSGGMSDAGGFSEFECMDLCLLDFAGTVGTTELDDCASACAEMGNSVSAVTRALFECMVGDCNAGCY